MAVYILDPRHHDTGEAVSLQVPASFLPKISQGAFELGDADEPTNSYQFGKKAEIFELTYTGKAQCKSGYVGIKTIESIKGSTKLAWPDLKDRIDKETVSYPDSVSGLLFAGPVIQADSISVYKLEEAGAVIGMVLTSDVEDMD